MFKISVVRKFDSLASEIKTILVHQGLILAIQLELIMVVILQMHIKLVLVHSTKALDFQL